MSTDISSIVDRLVRLLEMQAEIAADIKDIKTEAASDGLDPALLMKVARLKLADAAKRKKALDQHEMLDVYLSACGLTFEPSSPVALHRDRGRQEVGTPPSAQDDTDGNQGEAAAGRGATSTGRSTGATSAGAAAPVSHTPEVSQVVTPSVPAPLSSQGQRRPAAEASASVSAATLPPHALAPHGVSAAGAGSPDPMAPAAREMEIV